MKRRLSMISATAILLSAAMFCSCDVQDIVVNGSAGSPTDETAVGTVGVPGTSVAIGIPEWDWIHPLPPDTGASPCFPRVYAEIGDFEAYKKSLVNLNEMYYDNMVDKLCIYRGFDYTVTDEFWDCGTHEFPSNLFDGTPETKWCSGSTDVAGVSAIVWSNYQPIYVTAYSFTTTPHAAVYPDRDPIRWRLYAANELPNDSMDCTDPETGLTYFKSMKNVPEGWVLIDSVDAQDPSSREYKSLIPDKSGYEAGLELPCPGYYRYFMLLIDECEGDTFEMGDFTLYGYDSFEPAWPTIPCTEFVPSYHPYKEIEDFPRFVDHYVNLTEKYFDSMNSELSIYRYFDYQTCDELVEYVYYPESPFCLFDCDVATKWCAASYDVQYASAVVWSMTEAVNVVGYSITTANDNSAYTDRNPISWRLYATNELPSERMDEIDPDAGDTYLDSETVPDGWVLVDAVDASCPDDPLQSQIPDEDYFEVGMMAANPGCYKYFMLLIDWCEGNGAFQMSEFTLYGTVG